MHREALFALSKDEGGEVSIMEHDIDTGQSPPIGQAPHRVPFALHPVVTQIMLKECIVQESDSP